MTSHNDSNIQRSDSFSSSGGSSSHPGGGVNSVAQAIVHRETAAVATEGIVDNRAISASLAGEVSRKAFFFEVQVADEEANPGRRVGQAGLIRCRAPTVPGSPPEAKKQKLMHKYGPAAPVPAPAIKQSSSAARVSVVPITTLHNVVKDRFQGVHYEVSGTPLLGNIAGVTKVIDFRRRNEAISSVTAKRISFLGAESFSWKYGFDMTRGNLIRKITTPQTDPSLSFEAVDSSFEYKVGQKIGMAVYRNYEFDFTNDDIYTNNHWKKEDLPKEDILRIFGTDNAVNIYTGEITAVSQDNDVFRHSINSFRGCAGAIVFLLDKNQDLVEPQHYGKAIGVHVGAIEETTFTTASATASESRSSEEKFNFAFALAGFEDKVESEEEEE